MPVSYRGYLVLVVAVMLNLFTAKGALAQCGLDCTTVSPAANVPLNIDVSNAVQLQLDAAPGYRFWAVGESYHASVGGRYTDVLAASGYGSGDLFSIPVGGAPVELAPSVFAGTRLVNLFFVEFGSGVLGDNHGSTTVYYEPIGGGPVQSVTVSPVQNIAFNCGASNAAVHDISLADSYLVCATGISQYADVLGVYGGVFLCVQGGAESHLKVVPIGAGGTLYLSTGSGSTANPAYLWFPEFGSGETGDNHGSTEVCFTPGNVPVRDATWGQVKVMYRQ